jgi:hypothetical protein
MNWVEESDPLESSAYDMSCTQPLALCKFPTPLFNQAAKDMRTNRVWPTPLGSVFVLISQVDGLVRPP